MGVGQLFAHDKTGTGFAKSQSRSAATKSETSLAVVFFANAVPRIVPTMNDKEKEGGAGTGQLQGNF